MTNGWLMQRLPNPFGRAISYLAMLVSLAVLAGCGGRGQAAGAAEDTPLRIGIIGSGTMGGGIGVLWASAGHEVFFSSRNPDQLTELVQSAGSRGRAGFPAEAVEFGDVILLAVPSGALPDVGAEFASHMRGKVVIELGNPRADRDGPLTDEWLAMGTGLATAQYFPGVRLVKGFNTLGSANLREDAHRPGERIAVPLAGDDPEALRIAARLVEDAGFDPVIVGPLARAKEFDRNTPVYDLRGRTARQARELLGLPEP